MYDQRVFNVLQRAMGFSPSYDLVPSPPPAPSRVSQLTLFLFPVCRRSCLLSGMGGGGVQEGEGAKSYDGKKAWSSIIH
jgi:hypothetical protein